MTTSDSFVPQWTSPPGHTVADLMRAHQLSHGEVSERLNAPPAFLDGLLDGREVMTLGVARRLQEVVGGSAAFWMTRDRQYRDDVARLRKSWQSWLLEFPLQDMARFGWIPSDPPEGFEVEMLLRYFDVPSVSVWRTRYAEVLQHAAFRTSSSYTSTPGAVAAWLRQGERFAETAHCATWDSEALQRTLPEVRALTRVRDPQRFLPKLKAAMSRCGVAIVVLEAPSACRASGAVRWLTDEKALMLVSARHLSDDHFWFTVFHECGHLLLHRDGGAFLDEEGDIVTELEAEANQFAADTLIPPAFRSALATVRAESLPVTRLASEIGIAPGIVVAQLQRQGRVPHARLNKLKRRYTWSAGELISR